MKTEDKGGAAREMCGAKLKLAAAMLYEEEAEENARIMAMAEDGGEELPDYAERAFEAAYAHVRREGRKKRWRRAAAGAAALALAIFAASAMFDINVEALMKKAYTLLFTETATYNEITAIDRGADADIAEEMGNSWFPEYIPEGYELSLHETYTTSTIMIFVDSRENQIRIEEHFADRSKTMLDNDGTYGETAVHGETAFWSETDDGIYLSWPHGGHSVLAFADTETLDTLVKIVESMKPRM
ncbi:MAG: DUF4367 domain-containing protein [Clostridiales Family XIII bacterium]|jgi:hypothetical protein|nr:DUF4367 domain-containing protein [Clostridiales Family XIII bacterium]